MLEKGWDGGMWCLIMGGSKLITRYVKQVLVPFDADIRSGTLLMSYEYLYCTDDMSRWVLTKSLYSMPISKYIPMKNASRFNMTRTSTFSS